MNRQTIVSALSNLGNNGIENVGIDSIERAAIILTGITNITDLIKWRLLSGQYLNEKFVATVDMTIRILEKSHTEEQLRIAIKSFAVIIAQTLSEDKLSHDEEKIKQELHKRDLRFERNLFLIDYLNSFFDK